MKKIALFTALLTLGLAVNAQTLNVQSAMSDLKRGYLNKAKASIDKACVHEDTKEDAKTWYYAGLIYSMIGDAATDPQSKYKKYKDLDPDWCQKAYDAAMRCKELDKAGDFDLKYIFSKVGSTYYNKSIELFNAGNYKDALELSDKAAKVLNNSGDPDLANESIYIAGYCCQMLKDNEGVKKYYGPLVRRSKIKEEFKPRMQHVYTVMYGVYKDLKDTANVIKTAERYTKVLPEDPAANLLLANAYIWTGNNAKAIELANKAIDESKNTPAYPKMLCAAASVYEQSGDYATAEAKYNESSQLQPNQFEANYGMASMMINRASEKNDAINKIVDAGDFSEESDALMAKLTEERNAFFRQAIPYLKTAINHIDGLNEEEQAQYRPQLYSCLRTLNICYVTLEMYEDAKPVKARLDKIEAGANN
ncbi:MAG: tetratricopeptide repeat protein [Bacteroidales bacterium]|nr:tetratricopeptide repeat protein [Bacteroidales bacterium]